MVGVPVIVTTEHGANPWKGKKHILAERLLTRITDIRICNSGYTRRIRLSLCESPPEKLTVIWNGVEQNFADSAGDGREPRLSLGIAPGDKVIGTVGRLTEAKGIEHLMLASRRLGGRVSRVLIVGDGPKRKELDQLANRLGVAHRIVFAGTQPDVAPFIAAMDILVIPSVREAFGLVAVEAMACARPVVAFAVGGIPEIVSDGETGLLVKPRDVEGLAQAILKLLEDESLRAEMGRKGREAFLKYFTAERNALLVRQWYEKILEEKQGFWGDDAS